MAANSELKNLRPNTTVMVQGKVAFSRIFRQLDGLELQQDQQRAAQFGRSPVMRPYTKMELKNPKVIPKSGDDNNMTPEEIYMDKQIYDSQKNGDRRFQGKNTSQNVPWVGIHGPDGQGVTEITLEGELDNDLDVTLVMRIFYAKKHMTNGVSMDGVIINEPIRYYGSGGDPLADYGIKLTRLPAGQPTRIGNPVMPPIATQGNMADSPVGPAAMPPQQAAQTPPPPVMPNMAPPAGDVYATRPPVQSMTDPFPAPAQPQSPMQAMGQAPAAPAAAPVQAAQPMASGTVQQTPAATSGIAYDPTTGV